MALTFVQTAAAFSNPNTSVSVAYPVNTTGGSYLVLFGLVGGTATVTDTLGNTWIAIPAGGWFTYHCPSNKIGGGANTVTITGTVSQFSCCVIAEYTGQALTNPLDAYVQANSSTGSLTAGPILGNFTDEQYILIGYATSGGGSAAVAGAGYTIRPTGASGFLEDGFFAIPASRTASITNLGAAFAQSTLLSVKTTTSVPAASGRPNSLMLVGCGI